MLARLQSTSGTVTQTIFNSRVYDIIKLATGQVTNISGLNQSIWDIPASSVVATIPGNWSVLYSSIALDSLADSTSYFIILSKSSTVAGKNVRFKLTVTSLNFTMSVGEFASDGSEDKVIAFNGINHDNGIKSSVGLITVVSTNLSSILIGSHPADSTYTTVMGVERSHYSYDTTSTENLGVGISFANISTSIINLKETYSPSSNSYMARSTLYPSCDVTGNYYNIVGVSRDSNGAVALPFLPIYVQDLAEGWLGGNLSTLSQVFFTASDIGKFWDKAILNEKTYRMVPIRNYQSHIHNILVCEE